MSREPYEIYAKGYEAGHKDGLEEVMSRDAAEKVGAWKPDWKVLPMQHDQELVNSMIERVAEAMSAEEGNLKDYHQCQDDAAIEEEREIYHGYIWKAESLLKRASLISSQMTYTLFDAVNT